MAIFLATHYNLKAVLINPSINPALTLQKAKGLNYYDLSSFEWNTQHLTMLENFKVTHPNPDNYLLLLQKGDETLDYREALHFFEHQGINPDRIILEEGGNHSFENIESKFEIMDAFFDT